jgi:2-iminobutanoate/2-iminopropanoate deaminase
MTALKSIEIIRSADVPIPGGHYSHAVAHDGTVFVSGQLGRGPDMTEEEAGDIRVQTRRALHAVAAILRAAGTDISRTLKVTVYVSDVALWPALNAEYAEVLGAHRPARSVVPTGPLHYGALVEIDAVAAGPL